VVFEAALSHPAVGRTKGRRKRPRVITTQGEPIQLTRLLPLSCRNRSWGVIEWFMAAGPTRLFRASSKVTRQNARFRCGSCSRPPRGRPCWHLVRQGRLGSSGHACVGVEEDRRHRRLGSATPGFANGTIDPFAPALSPVPVPPVSASLGLSVGGGESPDRVAGTTTRGYRASPAR